jgi:hypothetical protein
MLPILRLSPPNATWGRADPQTAISVWRRAASECVSVRQMRFGGVLSAGASSRSLRCASGNLRVGSAARFF